MSGARLELRRSARPDRLLVRVYADGAWIGDLAFDSANQRDRVLEALGPATSTPSVVADAELVPALDARLLGVPATGPGRSALAASGGRAG